MIVYIIWYIFSSVFFFFGVYKYIYIVIIKMVVRGICLLLITVHFQVVIPRTYSKYTTRRVLTTQWIDGEKLSQSKESNVGELVNVGVICYLKQVIYYLGKLH
jgi:hypothetical protein